MQNNDIIEGSSATQSQEKTMVTQVHYESPSTSAPTWLSGAWNQQSIVS